MGLRTSRGTFKYESEGRGREQKRGWKGVEGPGRKITEHRLDCGTRRIDEKPRGEILHDLFWYTVDILVLLSEGFYQSDILFAVLLEV